MRVVQATFGTFHSFNLAAELLRRGHLLRIYSTFPWRRLQREDVPRAYVETFPWLHTGQFLAGRFKLLPQPLLSGMTYEIAKTFDAWLTRRIPACDALIALSGSALDAGKKVQQRGGVFLCDRGSTHHAFQRRVLQEEFARWGLPYRVRDDRQQRRELTSYEQADAIVVPSRVARRTFLAEGVAAEKVFTIPYGVRLERFSKVADCASDRFDVLFAGAVSVRKGIPYLLEAFARLSHPNKRLRIVGSMSSEIEGLLSRLPQQHVEFLGSLPQSQLRQIFSSSHVLVLPSLEEGLALVQGQALACGCPVIATEATGAEDLFTDGVEGFILPQPDVEALTARLQELADAPALQQRMSEAAMLRVRTLGGWSTYGDLWVELLTRLTGKA